MLLCLTDNKPMSVLQLVYFLATILVVQINGQNDWKRWDEGVCRNIPFLMTTDSGTPLENLKTTKTVGCRGPVVLDDTILIEELAHLDREKIPERTAHAKGAGAFGYFKVTDLSITRFCKASLFQKLGKITKLAIRFSTSNPERGSCDTVRGLRGTAMKFYTEEGNYDLVGGHVEPFALRDPILITSLLHSQRRHPATSLLDPNSGWDFATLTPQVAHQFIVLLTDRGTPDGYRYMDMFGTHAFKVVNKYGEAFYTKFHFKSDQGIRTLNLTEAVILCGLDPDYATRDLYTAIANRSYPSWTWYYQIMTLKETAHFRWNPFDPTKVWPQEEYPLHEIGKVVLNGIPNNFFTEVEQSAFSPSNMVPGIEPSPDRVLQARMFCYPDTQRYRLGINYQQLPVNQPKCPALNINRDGVMAYYNQGNLPNYYPNSVGPQLRTCPTAASSVYPVTGNVERCNTEDEDNFYQPRVFYERVLKEKERETLITNLVASIQVADPAMQVRVIKFWTKVSEHLGQRLTAAVNTSTSISYSIGHPCLFSH